MTTTSYTLIYRLKTGDDAEALERFVRIYTPMLMGWSMRSGLSFHNAEDLVQSLLILISQKVQRFDEFAATSGFRGWLKTVLMNAIRDHARKRQVKTLALNEKVEPNAAAKSMLEESWDREYQQQLVHQALQVMRKEFEESTWKACWERTVNGHSAQEVGRMLNMSAGAVNVAKSRVLQRLRQELKGLWE